MATNILSVFEQDYVGSGILLGKFENQSPEWHALRATGIGGSDVGTICGVNPWQSPFTLWAKRTGRIGDNIEPNAAMEWGTRLERVILEKFADEHPELTIFDSPGTFHHRDRRWQLANPDAIYRNAKGEFGIVEVKTARFDWEDGVPLTYQAQVQWYLHTFGFRHAHVVVLFAGSTYKEFEILADDFQQQANLEKVLQFKKFLDEDLEPDYDGASDTYQTVRQLHPLIDDFDIELGDLGIRYCNAIADLAEAESKANEMKSRVMAAMGTAKRGLVDDLPVVTRQAKNGGAPFLVNKRK